MNAVAWSRLAVCVVAAVFAGVGPSFAGPGHDHGDEAPAASSNGPQRQPDGSVFLPKPAQRQLSVRTLPVVEAELPRAFELAGRVVMDPNAGGRVQATVAGRIEGGAKGLPSVGQTVRKGEVLAWVVPSSNPIERSNQVAQVADLKAAAGLGEKRLARLTELKDTVPRKDIEAAEADLRSLRERIAALGSGLDSREALVAPVAGVIASSHVVSGQVVDSRELVFEVVNPSRMRIEALAYDAAQAADVAAASLVVGQQRMPLRFIGASRSLREQALPMHFAGEGPLLAQLAIGQPVRVVVQSRSRTKGFAVPSASLMKNPSNQTIVWVKMAPERFEPRVVTFEPLDGTQVAVTSGLEAGDRVATQGATLINQVR